MMMQARDAAQIVHDWACAEGLFPGGPVTPVQAGPEDFKLIQPQTDVGKQALRAKIIQAVAYNDAAAEVVVFTRKAAAASKKAISLLPQKIDDVSIRYRQGVQTPVGTEPAVPFGGPPFATRVSAAGTFYTCGSSISVGNFRDAGTLSCLVKMSDGTLCGLSNNHVTGSCSYAGVGMPIVAPGIHDVGPGSLPPFTIGFHTAALTLVTGAPDIVDHKRNLDAAIFRIADPGKVSSFQRDVYDTPAQAGPLIANAEVEKVGRTTGHTKGKVLGQMIGGVSIPYSAAAFGFSGPVYAEPMYVISGYVGLFSDNGDSGSLITSVVNGVRLAVGIVVGGLQDGSAPGGRATLALPIEPILAEFKVSLVSGHNI